MNRADLTEQLHTLTGLSRRECATLVEGALDLIKANLLQGNDVRLSGFGNFTVHTSAARMGRNPKTRQEVPIPARKTVRFHPSPLLRDTLQPDSK